MTMRGGVYDWTFPSRLEQIREEMRLKQKRIKKSLPQGEVTSVFLCFACWCFQKETKKAESPEYFLFF
jgi:hypothetical protein